PIVKAPPAAPPVVKGPPAAAPTPVVKGPPAAPSATAPTPAPEGNLDYAGLIAHGHELLKAGQVPQAKKQFEQATQLQPTDCATARTGLGLVAMERNRVVLASDQFEKATRGGDDNAWYGLAEAYRRLGRTRDAVRAYQNYVERRPNGEQLGQARAQLDRLNEELALGHNKPQ
ncbi:MAG: tetratricopeptide repeat protein, partial [Polyangiales bacterium]